MLLAAAVGVAWRVLPQRRAYLTDAESIKEPLATARVRDVLWEPPTRLPNLINSGAEDYEPRLSADGMTLFFVRGKAGENADIYFTSRSPRGWGDPHPLTEVNSEADELGPQPSADGEAIYFYSNRAGGFGGYDLWVLRRGADGDWRAPENLGPTVNSEFNDYGPALTPDGKTLYFSSNRPQPGDVKTPDPNAWPATLREDLFHRTYDLYAAAITDRGVGRAEPINSLNTPHNEGASAVSSFGDFLYFASDRPDGAGAFDLYRSRRLRGEYEAATNLGDAVNTRFNELDPALSMGGFGLDFSSDRTVAGRSADAAREYNLYHTNSREVFAEAERIDHPPIDWAGLWAAIGPNLLWALLALLLLLLMLMLFKGVRNRKLSLLMRCLLASLAAHILLLLLFHVWQVAAALAGEFHRKGPIQIALASTVRGDTIAAQIRGHPADFQTPPPAEVAVKRQLIPLTTVANDVRADLPVEHQPIEIAAELTLEASAADAAVRRQEPIVPLLHVEMSEAARAVDVTIPTDGKRVDVPEPDGAAQALLAEPQSIARPPSDVSVAPALTTRQALMPPPTGDAVSDTPPQSLAPARAPREATPALRPTSEDAPRLLVAEALSIAEARLPEAPDRPRVAEAPEVSAAPPTDLPLPARAAPLESARSIPPDGPVAELKPAGVVAPSTDVRLVADSSANVADASPPPSPPKTGFASAIPTEPETSNPMKLDLTLPKEEQPPVDSNDRRLAGGPDTSADEQPMGTIRGVVTEAATEKPVRGVMVRLVLPDRSPLSVKTGADGGYSLVVPPMPEFFALSASRRGFVPSTTNVNRSAFADRGEVVVDFKLERTNRAVTATEAVPDVHHLGDDRFDGTINSRFQKQSEGSSFAATFEVDGGLLKSPVDRAELRLLVKGVQRRHRIHINDRLLPRRLDDSPEDGGFGEFVAPFDASLLVAGTNTLRIVAAPSSDDIDDFEFVNIRVYLIPSSRANATGL
jgi:hypothetical protein